MQANHAQGDPARDFQNWELVLSRSEKGGIGWNSRYFNRVKAALQRTAKAMENGEIEGAMSSLSIAVAGLLTVVVAPFFAGLL